MITRQAEAGANRALISLVAQRREAVIYSCARGSFVVIATDIHFYPTSDRLSGRDFRLLRHFQR